MLTRPSCLLFALWLIASAAGLARGAGEGEGAKASPPGIAEVRLGLGGQFKLGHWTPVWVRLQAGAEALRGNLTISAPDGDDIWARYAGGALDKIEVPSNQSQEVQAYVRIGRQYGRLLVELQNENKKLSHTVIYGSNPPAILASQQRVVVLGSPGNIEQATKFLPRRPGEEIVTTHIADAAALPDQWYGYDGVDALVLTTDRLEFYNALTPAQREALELWVRLGGRVILSVGRQGETALANGSLLGQLAPGTFQRTVPLRSTAAIEQMAEASQRIDALGTADSPALLRFTQLTDFRGQVVLAGASNEPILIRAPYGLGTVLFLGLDLDQPPLSIWAGHGRFVARLLDALWNETTPTEEQRAGGKVSHLGFSDLAGQLRAALDQFPGVNLTPFSWIAALIVAYIVLIGPVDYFVLRRINRMELTWITFTLMAIGLGVAAWLLADWARGEAVHTNQVDVVDIDSTTKTIRGTSWLQIYSPRSERFNLALVPEVPTEVFGKPTEVLLAWQGLPGSGLAGMDAASRLSAGDQSYTIADTRPASEPADLKLTSLPIGDGMTRSLIARWRGDLRAPIDSQLQAGANNLLHGPVENKLPVKLTDCVLYFDRWAWPLGEMQPGASIPVETLPQPLDVKWMLNERRVLESREVSVPWDQAMRDDVPRIVRLMMFHEAAQGRSFTRLSNRYNSFIDLSTLLPQRAMLVGQAESAAAMLQDNSKPLTSKADRRWTFYRVVLPVQTGAQ